MAPTALGPTIDVALYPVDGHTGKVRIWGLIPEEARMTGHRMYFQLNKTIRSGKNFARLRPVEHMPDRGISDVKAFNVSDRSREFDFTVPTGHPLVKALRAAAGRDEFGITAFPVRLYPDQPSAEVGTPVQVSEVGKGRRSVRAVGERPGLRKPVDVQAELPL